MSGGRFNYLDGSLASEMFNYLSPSYGNLCYDMNIDPFILDYWQPGQNYIVTQFEPKVPFAEN